MTGEICLSLLLMPSHPHPFCCFSSSSSSFSYCLLPSLFAYLSVCTKHPKFSTCVRKLALSHDSALIFSVPFSWGRIFLHFSSGLIFVPFLSCITLSSSTASGWTARPSSPQFYHAQSPKIWFPWSHMTLNHQEIDLIPAPIRNPGLLRNWNQITLCPVDFHMRNLCWESLNVVQTTRFTCSVLILGRLRLSSSPWIKSAFVWWISLFPKECPKT